MAQLSRGQTFVDGGTGNASMLHSLVDNGTLRPGAILDQAASPPADTDVIMFLQASSGSLKRGTLTQVHALIPANAANNVASLRRLGTAANMAAPGDDARFPARLTGIRMANGSRPDTEATPGDTAFPPVNLTTAGTVIDWDAGNIFYDTISSNKAYTFTNQGSGRRILVMIKTQGHTPTFPALLGDDLSLPGGSVARYIIELFSTPLGVSGYIVSSQGT